MRFEADLTMVNGATDPDPVASPGTVPTAMIVELRERGPNDQRPNRRLLFALEAPTAESTTFEVYALHEDDREKAAASRRWFLVGTVTTLSGGAIDCLDDHVVGGGLFYVRQTAETMTVDRTLHIRASA